MRDAPTLVPYGSSDDSKEKARAVWRAAFPNAEPLDAEVAAKIAGRISFMGDTALASELLTSKRLYAAEHTHLERVQLTARTLMDLLSDVRSGGYRIVGAYEDLDRETGSSEHFDNLCANLSRLSDTVGDALNDMDRMPPTPLPKHQSLLDHHICALAEIFETYSGEDAGTSSSLDGGRTGPFVRFVQEAARQFGDKVPAGETIAAALRKRRIIRSHKNRTQ
jgi:hypothetical protein